MGNRFAAMVQLGHPTGARILAQAFAATTNQAELYACLRFWDAASSRRANTAPIDAYLGGRFWPDADMWGHDEYEAARVEALRFLGEQSANDR